MGRKSAAVLDIRSSEVSVVVGERGVNHTIVFQASHTESYDGYENGVFYDSDRLGEKIKRCIEAVEKTTSERIRTLYVGVPGDFTLVIPQEQSSSFPKRRKITQKEVSFLREKGIEEKSGYRLIHTASMIYITADNRRAVDPIGLYSTSLKALLSYTYCSEQFAGTLEQILSAMKIEAKFLPTELAMACYLIPEETRDEYALFLDSGFLSANISILLGGGTLTQANIWAGSGKIIARLITELSLPYGAACAILERANLYARPGIGKTEFYFGGNSYEIDADKFTDIVKEGLDELCERIAAFFEDKTGKEIDYKPIYVSGEGVTMIRGALDHMTKRLSRVCEEVAPNLPYYNKPSMSSRIALVDMAYEDRLDGGFFYRLFH